MAATFSVLCHFQVSHMTFSGWPFRSIMLWHSAAIWHHRVWHGHILWLAMTLACSYVSNPRNVEYKSLQFVWLWCIVTWNWTVEFSMKTWIICWPIYAWRPPTQMCLPPHHQCGCMTPDPSPGMTPHLSCNGRGSTPVNT